MLFWILFEEFQLLLNEQFVYESTRAVVQSDVFVALQYLVHAEAALTVLFALCTLMGASC